MLRTLVVVTCAVGLLATLAATASAQTLIADYKFNNALNLGEDSSGNANDAVNTGVTPGAGRNAAAITAGVFNGAGATQLLRTANLNGGRAGLPGYTF